MRIKGIQGSGKENNPMFNVINSLKKSMVLDTQRRSYTIKLSLWKWIFKKISVWCGSACTFDPRTLKAEMWKTVNSRLAKL